jgi:hypothetical protein
MSLKHLLFPIVLSISLAPVFAHAGFTTAFSTKNNAMEGGPFDRRCRFLMTLDSQKALKSQVSTAVVIPKGPSRKPNPYLKRPQGAPYLAIAVDPKFIPLGTLFEMKLPGSDEIFTALAADTGGAIRGQHIDIATCFADERVSKKQGNECSQRLNQYGKKPLKLLGKNQKLSDSKAVDDSAVFLRPIGKINKRKTSMAKKCGTPEDQEDLAQTFSDVFALAEKYGDPKSLTNQWTKRYKETYYGTQNRTVQSPFIPNPFNQNSEAPAAGEASDQ